MPGYKLCHWCNGKGCMCCEAEERKHKEAAAKAPKVREESLYAQMIGTTDAELLRYKTEVDQRSLADGSLVPDLPIFSGECFRYCGVCAGSGCAVCESSMELFIAQAVEASPEWRPADVRDIRDAVVRAERVLSGRERPAMSREEVEELFRPLLDAEYKRQFPDGPKPIAAFHFSATGVTGWVK